MPRNLFTPAAPAGSLTCSRVTMAPCTDSWRDPSASVVVHTISMAMGMDATCALACGGGGTQGWGGLAREKTRAAGQYYVTLHKFNVHGASRTHGTEIKGSKHSPWNHHIKHHINLVRSAHCEDFPPRGCCNRVRCPAITLQSVWCGTGPMRGWVVAPKPIKQVCGALMDAPLGAGG